MSRNWAPVVVALCAIVAHGSARPDRWLIDDDALMRAATLLLSGSLGEKQLLADLSSRDATRRHAAAVTLFHANEERFLRPLLALADDPATAYVARDTALRAGQDAVPILERNALRGSPGAVTILGRFPSSKPLRRRLAESHQSPSVRTAALWTLLNDREVVFGRLQDPSLEVRDAAIRILGWAPREYRKRMYFHDDPNVRARAAEAAQRWTGSDLDFWVELAEDPDVRVRRFAMLHIAACARQRAESDVGLLDRAIRSVRTAIVHGPTSVRETAVLAVRSWFLLWDEAEKWWPPRLLRQGEDLLTLSPLREELIRQARSAELRRTYVMEIHVEPAIQTLARTGDPRALRTASALIESGDDLDALKALPILGSVEAWNWLVSFLRRAAYDTRFPYQSRAAAVFQAGLALGAFKRKGPVEPLISLLSDRSVDREVRARLLMDVGRVAHERIARALITIVEDGVEEDRIKSNALYSLAFQPAEFVVRFLEQVARRDEVLGPAAQFALDEWRRRFGF